MSARGSMLLLLVAVAPLAARGEVYVQVEEASLYAAPDAASKRLARGTFGTACTQLEDAAGDWVKLRCEDIQGYMKAAEVGPSKFDLPDLLARARDPKSKPSERYEAALKAAWLMPDWDDEVLTLVRDAFFEAEFESFPNGGAPAIGRFDEDVYCDAEDRMVCVHAMFLERYDWYEARQRGDSVVVVFAAAKELHVVKVTIGPLIHRPVPPNKFHVRVIERSHKAAGEVLLTALGNKARKKPDNVDAPGPLVTPSPASLKLLDALPMKWLSVVKKDGTWVQDCSRPDFKLLIGVPGDSYIGLGVGQPVEVLTGHELREVAQAGRTFRFSYVIPGQSAPGHAVLIWPSDEPHIGLLNGRPFIPEGELPKSRRRSCGP